MAVSLTFSVAWAIALCLAIGVPSLITAPIEDDLLVFLVISALSLTLVDTLFSAKLDFVKKAPRRAALLHFIDFSKVAFLFLALVSSAYTQFKFPLMGVIGLPAVEYNEFGIPGVQGLVNAVFLAFVTAGFYAKRIYSGLRFSFWVYLIVLIYPMLILSRQLIMSAAVQIIFIWWFTSTARLYVKVRFVVVASVVLLLVFGLIGNIRTGDDVITSFLGDTANQSLSVLYWGYIYIASPISNLSFNIPIVVPDESISTLFSGLLPTPLRTALGINKGFDGFDNIEFINPNLNMSTYYAPGLFSFGWAGMYFLQALLVFVLVFLKSCAKFGQLSILSIAVLVQVAIFSPFTNLLLYLPVFFQVFYFIFYDFLSWFSKVISRNVTGVNNSNLE